MNVSLIKQLITSLVIITLYIIPNHVKAEESQPFAMKPLANVGGYEYFNDEKIGFATFMKGQTYRILSEDDKFYHVPFGNGFLYVDKKYAQRVTLPIQAALPDGTSTVIPKTRIYVKSLPKNNSYSLGLVNPNIRIPVIKEVDGYYEVNFGGTKGYIEKLQANKDTGIPVLMYHHMMYDKAQSDQANNHMTIEFSQFEEQMNYLKENKWKTITMEQLDGWLGYTNNLPDKVVAITFDDGVTSTVNLAYPLLKDLNFHATSFVITGKIRQSSDYWKANNLQYVGLKEIMETTDVYDYQHHSHNMHHYTPGTNAGMFKTESYEDIKTDLLNGQAQLGKAFSNDIQRTKYLAYPFGHYNQTTIDAAHDAGIRLAFTTIRGNVKLNDPPYELKRQGIAPNLTIKDFSFKLNGTNK